MIKVKHQRSMKKL